MHKIIINLGVAACEQSNAVGERFSADDSFLFARFVAAMWGRFVIAIGEVTSVDGRVAARAEVMSVSLWLIDGPRLCPSQRSVRWSPEVGMCCWFG